MEHTEPHHHLKLIVWTVSVVLFIALLAVIFLVLIPKPLVVAGTLKTKDGPVKAGVYDFRLKFYNATTRTDLVYSYDAKDVTVDKEGKFSANLPDGKALNVATLMQVCIASPDSAVPGTIIGGQATLPSCEVPEEADQAAFNQTICGLTAVDQDPTNPINWLASKSVVYATPTKACGESATGIASVSTVDIVAPLLETPGALGELLSSGVALQPGSLLGINENGEITVTTPTKAVSEIVKEEIAQNEAENQTVIDTPPTGTGSGINTAPQTLSLSGNVLTLSGGNSVTLPSGGSSGDEVIGNELTDVIPGDGLVRVGTGTTLDPFKVGLITCASGQLLKSNGTAAWSCAADTDTVYTAGTGIAFAGNIINNTGVLSFTLPAGGGLTNTGTAQSVSLRLQNCGNGEMLQFNGGTWVCVLPGGVSSYSFSISDGVTSEPIMNGDTVTFIGNEGLAATVSASDSVTYGIVNGGVTTIKLADGSVTNTKLANSSVTVTAGSGLSGGGAAALGGGTTLSLQACANNQILKHNGTTWVCAADDDTTYAAGTGLSLAGTIFNANVGAGLSVNGSNQIINSGVLTVSGGGAITSTGGQNPTIAFANGSTTGQFWQWNGSAWELATLPVDGDSIVGNEVTNVTGGNSGLVRSGSGTAVDPYTLAVSVGNGLLLTSGSVAINSPTCSGTTKLQWNGTAFVCSADVDTTNFSITDGSTTQGVAATDAITFLGNSNTKTTVILGGMRQLTFGLDTTGASSGQVLTYDGTNLAWQSPTTYAPTSCSATSTYICQNGNTLGTGIVIGTNDTQTLSFKTNNSTAMTILTNGKVGIGDVSPAQTLTVNGQIGMPATSSTTGILFIGGIRTLHAYGGISNIFVGQNSGNVTQTGTYNSGFGSQALLNVTSGSFNTAVSANGLLNTTTGSSNSAVGMQALLANTTGSENTAIGHNAGYTGTAGAFGNTTGNFNTFVGSLSGPGSATQLTNATAIGAYATVAQSNSVILGCVSGVVSCPQTTTIGIGNSAPSFLLHVGSATSMASGTTVARFQNAGGICSVIPSTAGGINCTSDERAKKNIEAFTGAVELLEHINIKKYNMKTDKDGTTKQIGVIAQEVEDVLPGLVVTDTDGSKSFSYAGLTPILLQAIKEQQVQIDQIKAGMWSGGVVTKDATFKSQAVFEGPARFVGEASFRGDVVISGKVKLSEDQVNAVILPKGKKSIGVTFGGSYASPPYITATPRDFLKGNQFRITNVTRTGFTIEANEAQSKPVRFDWHAFSR